MRKIILLGALLCASILGQAQYDSIRFVSGAKHAVKIIEVTEKHVKYKNPLDTLGPTFIVKRRDVEGFMLKGVCLPLEKMGYVDCVKDPTFDIIKADQFSRTIISVDVAQFFVRHFQLNVEHVFKGRKIGLSAFGNLGLSDETDYETYEHFEPKMFGSGYFKKYYYGMDVKFFAGAHKKFTYFFSIGADHGKAYREDIISWGDPDFPSWRTTSFPVYRDATYIAYRLNNGVVCRFSKMFIMQAVISIGAAQYNYYDKSEEEQRNQFLPRISATLLLGLGA